MKLRVAPESIKAERRKVRIRTGMWIKVEAVRVIEVSVACLGAPTSWELETASFPTAVGVAETDISTTGAYQNDTSGTGELAR